MLKKDLANFEAQHKLREVIVCLVCHVRIEHGTAVEYTLTGFVQVQ